MRLDWFRISVWFYLFVAITTAMVSNFDWAPDETPTMERSVLMGAFWPMYWLIRITFFYGGVPQ